VKCRLGNPLPFQAAWGRSTTASAHRGSTGSRTGRLFRASSAGKYHPHVVVQVFFNMSRVHTLRGHVDMLTCGRVKDNKLNCFLAIDRDPSDVRHAPYEDGTFYFS